MRKILWIILAALLVAISAPKAHAQILTYDITFVTFPNESGPPPTYGYFIYNQTTNQFLSFVVAWNGHQFDLTSPANNPGIDGVPSCASGDTGARATFDMMTVCPYSESAWIGTDGNGSPWDGPTFYMESKQIYPDPTIPNGVIYITSPPHQITCGPTLPPCVNTAGYYSASQIITRPPVGAAFGHLIHLVAGPVFVPPGVPVEVNLGFADINGNAIGPNSTVTLTSGETATLDLDMDTLVKVPGQRVLVRPVVKVTQASHGTAKSRPTQGQYTEADRAPGKAGLALRDVSFPVVTEVFDRSTGFGTVLVPVTTEIPAQPVFDFQGLAAGQTMQLIVTAAIPTDSCLATLSFADRKGNPVGPNMQAQLAPWQTTSLNLNADTLGLAPRTRIELKPIVTIMRATTCQASVEVFDNRTGRTWTYQSGEGHPPPKDYGCGYNKYCREINRPK
jgi:hypothetical protein